MAEKFYSIKTVEVRPVWYHCKIELDIEPTPEQLTDMAVILETEYDFGVDALNMEWKEPFLEVRAILIVSSMSVDEFNAIIDGLLGQVDIYYGKKVISDVGKVEYGFSKVR